MLDRTHFGRTGRLVWLRPSLSSLPHDVAASGERARPTRAQSWLEARPVRDATMLRIVGRRSGEALGFVRIGKPAGTHRGMAVAIGGACESGSMTAVLVDAAIIASGLALGAAQAETVAVSILGADRALRRRMRRLGFHEERPPQATLPYFLGQLTDESRSG